MKKIGVLVSGGGTNLQAILNAQESGILKSGKVSLVVTNLENAYALTRAKNAGVETAVVQRKSFATQAEFDAAIVAAMRAHDIDVICMAGFLAIMGEGLVQAYPHKIINIHPALIPSFCGKGFYGLHVHEAVLAYGAKVTGATVHFVNEVADGGEIILQKAVPVEEGDTPEVLQKRVMEQAEWQILPQALELLCADRLRLDGRRVMILPQA